MIGHHTVPDDMLVSIASGSGGTAAVEALWRGQHSRRLLLLKLAVDRMGTDSGIDDAVAAIVAAEEQDPAVRRVLVEPLVGVWAASSIRKRAGRGHLGGLAAAASLLAGTRADIPGEARHGWIHLPSIGRIRAPIADGPVRLTTDHGSLLVDGVVPPPAAWQQRRTVTCGTDLRLTVHVEDVDPYRDAYHVPAAERLPDDELGVWRGLLDDTWHILNRHAPSHASEIAAGLHSLVPLRKPSTNAAHSATAGEAVGVIGLDLPRNAADFAVALVHEFQHSKLSALLDIVPLYDRASTRTFFAPWRTDPRPIGGLLQGVYAFIGVTDMWRALATDPGAHPQAIREFAEARAQVTDALDTLARSGLMTAAGDRFVGGMTAAVERLHATEVPAATEDAAYRLLAGRRRVWEQNRARS